MKKCIEDYIGLVEEEGGKIFLDGCSYNVFEYFDGSFVGFIIVEVVIIMKVYK